MLVRIDEQRLLECGLHIRKFSTREITSSAASWTLTILNGAVCTENLIPFDCVTESPNVNGDDRIIIA